jgi:hypothetical protein
MSPSDLYLRFNAPPREDHPVVRDFLDHTRTTHQPETFPGLHPGPFDPAEPFRRVASFTIDRLRRPMRDRVPCPMCRRQNKFETGYLVCFPNLSVLGVIGRECACPLNQAASEADWKSRQRHQQEMGFLEATLPLVAGRLAQTARSRRAVEEAERVYRRLRLGGTWLHDLRRVAKQGGQLLVHELMDMRDAIGPSGIRSSGGSQTRLVFNGGLLEGTVATRTEFRPTATWAGVHNYLSEQSYAPGDDGLLLRLIELDEAPQERGAAYARLRWAETQWSKLRREMADFVAFFDPLNIQRINNWAGHPLNALGWSCRAQPLDRGRVLFAVEARAKPLVKVVIEPVLWDWNHPWS